MNTNKIPTNKSLIQRLQFSERRAHESATYLKTQDRRADYKKVLKGYCQEIGIDIKQYRIDDIYDVLSLMEYYSDMLVSLDGFYFWLED